MAFFLPFFCENALFERKNEERKSTKKKEDKIKRDSLLDIIYIIFLSLLVYILYILYIRSDFQIFSRQKMHLHTCTVMEDRQLRNEVIQNMHLHILYRLYRFV